MGGVYNLGDADRQNYGPKSLNNIKLDFKSPSRENLKKKGGKGEKKMPISISYQMEKQ